MKPSRRVRNWNGAAVGRLSRSSARIFERTQPDLRTMQAALRCRNAAALRKQSRFESAAEGARFSLISGVPENAIVRARNGVINGASSQTSPAPDRVSAQSRPDRGGVRIRRTEASSRRRYRRIDDQIKIARNFLHLINMSRLQLCRRRCGTGWSSRGRSWCRLAGR